MEVDDRWTEVAKWKTVVTAKQVVSYGNTQWLLCDNGKWLPVESEGKQVLRRLVQNPGMQIMVHSITDNQQFAMDINIEKWKVCDLKYHIAKKMGIDAGGFVIMFKGRPYNNNQSVRSMNLKRNCVVIIVPNYEGG